MMKKNKIKLIFVLSIFLLLFFTSLNIYTSYIKIKKTVEESVARQSLQAAKSIASSIDTEVYNKFLSNPEKNKYYWKIKKELNAAQEKTGSLYVYILAVDNSRQVKKMIVGLPERSKEKHPIGEPCTLPEKQVKKALQGRTYVTGIIENIVHKTSYVSVGAPIKDSEGKIIGYLGIDISAKIIHDISQKIVKNSFFGFVFNGLFVLVLLLSFFMIQKWYQKETKREIEETEDTYQSEFKSLISSVHSLRHDFTNHLQVLHGLLKLGEQSKALEYSSSLFKEVSFIETVKITTGHPGLSVLLQTKKLAAQNQHIDMKLAVSDHAFDKIKTIDLIKVLSNLIDNAIEATIELPEDKRKINITGEKNSGKYIFKISNTGMKIEDKNSIFKRGYSTKKAREGKIRGQGLFIVREVMSKYNGHISFDSTEKETTATVVIPVKK